MSKLMIILIRVYRVTLAPLLSGLGVGCRFYPSCSSYGIEAIETHGCIMGPVLTMLRVLRCHPFHPGGLDPVPERKKRAIRRALKSSKRLT